MKLRCDQMLIKLGRWLRIAGYDTAIITKSMPDRDIVQKALDEGSLFITRDNHFTEIKKAKNILVYLQANTIEDCISALNKQLSIDWTKTAFSRCIVCNQPLDTIEKQQVENEVPSTVQKDFETFWCCSCCKKIYWQGSHTKRMRATLVRWQTI